MAKQYITAEEPEKLAKAKVIPQWHSDLKNAKILYLFDEDGMKSKDRIIYAKIRKATPVEHYIDEIDLVLVVNYITWKNLDEKKRLALLDHEFCHVMKDEDKEGNTIYKMLHHDLEEFRAVYDRHGAWSADLEIFADQVQSTLNLEQAA